MHSGFCTSCRKFFHFADNEILKKEHYKGMIKDKPKITVKCPFCGEITHQ